MRARGKYPGLPLSGEIYKYMDDHPAFEESWKLFNRDDFVCLNCLFFSWKPEGTPHCEDQVLGIWYLDKKNLLQPQPGRPVFKQDFTVDVGERHEEYVHYTAPSIANRADHPSVRSINEFFEIYGENGRYYHKENGKWEHWYKDVDDLPKDPRLLAEAERVKAAVLAGQL